MWLIGTDISYLWQLFPISTEVIESNPDCALSGAYENGVLVITNPQLRRINLFL